MGSELFIRRPVMTTLLMVAFLFSGIFGYSSLPVAELPRVDFPTIQVSASVPGADASTMATTVATVLENQFTTIAGVAQLSSSSVIGQSTIVLQFDLDRNIDGAAEDVQTAITAASRQLPPTMPTPPTIRKVNPADQPIFFLAITSDTLPLSTVDWYAESLIARKLSTIEGVAQVNVWGSARFAVRVQADPAALAARGIGIDKLATAISSLNVNAPTGSFDYGTTRSSIIHANGVLLDADAFKHQVIAYQNGAPVRMSDVANVIDSTQTNQTNGLFNGKPMVLINFQRQPGANTVATVDALKAALAPLRAQIPESINISVEHDRSVSIRDAITDVQWTLLLAAFLVVVVIFLFLKTISATFIPSIALPIAIIGTFAGMALMGYSLDNLSLLALTLSVGFVVDDAIVMLENIVRHVEMGETPMQAAISGSKEISFTILSMTVSLAAVFIPVLFMGGIVGRLLHEMSVTIVIAILVSGIVSVTLTPMLCSRLLKPGHQDGHSQLRILQWSEAAFAWMQSGYARSLHWSVTHKRTILGVFFASVLATVGMFMIIPLDFLPDQDGDQVTVSTLGPNDMSYADMRKHMDALSAIAVADPNVGATATQTQSSNQGSIMLHLKPHPERKLTADQVITELRKKMSTVPGVSVFLINPPAIQIGGIKSRGNYQFTLQSLDRDALSLWAQKFADALSKTPDFVDVSTDALNSPSANVEIDRDRAAALGVSPQAIEAALGAAFGSSEVSTIYTPTDQFYVILELLPKYQQDPTSFQRLYVTANDGTLVPLSTVTKTSAGTIELQENHVGELPAITVSFNLVQGVALGDAVARIQKLENSIDMPPTIVGTFQGTAKAFQDSMRGLGILLLGAILVVYIVLGILYESFIHPLTILSGLPSAAVGALLTLYIFGVPLSLYAFVGIIMLIGIVKKNAIMMIDFALERERNEGISPEKAIEEAALIRFRPIMMTTMAALVGTLPIALGLGAGGDVRQPLGLAVVGGLLLSQLLTLYITPVIYFYLDRIGTKLQGHHGHGVPAQAE